MEYETLQWKNIYPTVFKSMNDIKLHNFQYKYIMRIVATNQFLTKWNIVGFICVIFSIYNAYCNN